MDERDEATEHGRGGYETGRGDAGARSELEDQIAALAGQVRRLGERLIGAAARPGPDPAAPAGAPRATTPPPPPASDGLSASILACAESVAAEIRASAEREAERIRSGALREADARIAGLRAMIEQQRETLAALSAEIGHLEHSASTMRAQSRALEAELAAIDRALAAAQS